jgi:hypothetical protein
LPNYPKDRNRPLSLRLHLHMTIRRRSGIGLVDSLRYYRLAVSATLRIGKTCAWPKRAEP